jgi:putative flippase GtrA
VSAPDPSHAHTAHIAGQGLRFLLFGLFNTALTYAVYCALVWLMPAQWAYALVFAGGIALAYWGNSRWVFRSAPSGARAALYPLVYLAQYVVNAALLHVAMRVFGLGPRLGLAAALVVGTPISFVLNRAFLTTAWRAEHGKHAACMGLIVALACIVYWRGYGGWWQGDDLANLYRLYHAQQEGVLWSQIGAWFSESFTPDSAFYRPLFMAQLALNYVVAGADYHAWFLVGLALHAINMVLIYLIVQRLGERLGHPSFPSGLAAALMCTLLPEHAEAVYWLLARADVYVCALSLLGLWLWIGSSDDHKQRSAWGLPLCLLLALGFKESAAVFALQMLCVAVLWPWPLTRAQRGAIAICLALLPVYFAWRWFLFGQAVQVYGGVHESGALTRVAQGLASLPDWWQGLTHGVDTRLRWPLALTLLALAAMCIAVLRGVPARRVAISLLLACVGMALATLMNLGAMPSNGESGRLWYVPIAWLLLALGVVLSTLKVRARRIALTVLALGIMPLAFYQIGLLNQAVQRAQHDLRDIAARVAPWAETHIGLTLLIVPDHVGPMVMARNAQGALVLPPIQAQGYLHRVLLTLPQEIALRRDQLARGLGTRLVEHGSRAVDRDTLARLLEPTDIVRWPDHYACWDMQHRAWRALTAPDTSDTTQWIANLQRQAQRCSAADFAR